jgi:hypothetical protein
VNIALAMEAVRTSETLSYFSETTRRYIPEGCHLHTLSVASTSRVLFAAMGFLCDRVLESTKVAWSLGHDVHTKFHNKSSVLISSFLHIRGFISVS